MDTELARRPIVVGTDFSPDSRIAADHAAAWARALGSEILLVHAWRGLEAYFADLHGVDFDAARGRLEGALDQEARRLRALGAACEPHLARGAPSVEIAELARASAAGLVVVGTRGRTRLHHVLIGSVTERVMRIAHCPVLTVPEFAADTPSIPLESVVIGIDFSPHSRRALATANDLSKSLGWPRRILVHGFSPTISWEDAENRRLERRTRVQRLREIAREIRTDQWEAVSRVLDEPGHDAVVSVANEVGANLIVVGTRGRSVTSAVLLGSTTQRIARTARCATLSIPELDGTQPPAD